MDKKRSLTIIGWGNQAKAWALNLRDRKWHITVALRENSTSIANATQMDFPTIKIGPQFESLDSFALLIPDHEHPPFFQKYGALLPPSRLIYAHGASLAEYHWEKTYPHLSHLLLAPKAIASELRFQFQTNGSLGAVHSLEASNNPQQDQIFIEDLALDLGITAGPYPTTFSDETLADLSSEQGLLCGLLPYAALAAFNSLRQRGVTPELALMECWHEVKFIAKVMIDKGPVEFFQMISPNALIGSEYARQLFLDKNYFEKWEKLCCQIEEGKFFSLVHQTDFIKTKADVLRFWEQTELYQTYMNLENKLFHGREKS